MAYQVIFAPLYDQFGPFAVENLRYVEYCNIIDLSEIDIPYLCQRYNAI